MVTLRDLQYNTVLYSMMACEDGEDSKLSQKYVCMQSTQAYTTLTNNKFHQYVFYNYCVSTNCAQLTNDQWADWNTMWLHVTMSQCGLKYNVVTVCLHTQLGANEKVCNIIITVQVCMTCLWKILEIFNWVKWTDSEHQLLSIIKRGWSYHWSCAEYNCVVSSCVSRSVEKKEDSPQCTQHSHVTTI